ncbi:MAG: cofactor-independent phosphoglycerate mutase [Clostridia bacterium]|nr:cofactor-independent phosphoglycerate mutase [Clostridia bacterium]
MKNVVFLCDGMADRPVDILGGKTPMEAAFKPNMDLLASTAEIGLVKTVPDGYKPGSDVANLSVMGYAPAECYTGRSPLEAASIGIDLKDTDVTLRCNIVTLSEDEPYEKKVMIDYCAGDISTAEAAEIIASVEEHFGSDKYRFYAGVSYRHCLVVNNGTTDLGTLTPPHDISDRVIGEYLSDSPNAAPLIAMMKESYEFLKDHPVNKARVAKGLRPANSIWLWGEGKRPALENFKEKFGVEGGVVSAVDLVKGIGRCAGMKVAEVEGATGYLDTNFEGKARAAVELMKSGCDLVYVHMEAPDECGHRGEAENKVKAIELIDSRVIPIVLDALKDEEDFGVMILPDHPTPLCIKTHSSEPVPYMIYRKKSADKGCGCFCEKAAEESGNYIDPGSDIMSRFLGM